MLGTPLRLGVTVTYIQDITGFEIRHRKKSVCGGALFCMSRVTLRNAIPHWHLTGPSVRYYLIP